MLVEVWQIVAKNWVFKRGSWQAQCQIMMKRKRISYRTIAQKMKYSKTALWEWITQPNKPTTLQNMLAICTILDLDPREFIIRDEVQLKLL